MILDECMVCVCVCVCVCVFAFVYGRWGRGGGTQVCMHICERICVKCACACASTFVYMSVCVHSYLLVRKCFACLKIMAIIVGKRCNSSTVAS